MNNVAGTLALNMGEILWDGSELTDELPSGATFEWNAAGYYEIKVGSTVTPIVLGKAGSQSLSVKETSGATAITGATTVVVNADRNPANAIAKVVEANSDNVISVKKGAVSGPFTVQLTDAYGNNISVTSPKVVKFAPESGAPLAVRGTTDGVTLTQANVTSTRAFYVAVDSSAVVDDEWTLELQDSTNAKIGEVTLKVVK